MIEAERSSSQSISRARGVHGPPIPLTAAPGSLRQARATSSSTETFLNVSATGPEGAKLPCDAQRSRGALVVSPARVRSVGNIVASKGKFIGRQAELELVGAALEAARS
jgi:hypothetical protein